MYLHPAFRFFFPFVCKPFASFAPEIRSTFARVLATAELRPPHFRCYNTYLQAKKSKNCLSGAKIPLQMYGAGASSPPEWLFLGYFSTENAAN
jgi:hypothetical protein